ncbi:MAG: sugar ABC transporter ATP-binding protein [Calditrichaeota bacterium]|nr:sugar ABC transporter ATP-binding protein [Calditrichota bacterium]
MEHIGKVFPGVIALDDVQFELCQGKVHILLGENGAGKSTLMKILSGAYQKTAGRILLEGADIEIKSPGHAQALGISIIYQELNLVPYLSAGENIFLGREPTKIPGVVDFGELYGKAQMLLDGLGVEINAKTPVAELGIAQQQMVEVAKALSLDARILIMDEPTSSLTEQEIGQLFAAIRKLRDKGVAIVYISHRMEELFEIGDRVTVLRDGRYVGTHKLSDISKDELVQMMVGRQLTQQYPKRSASIGEEVLRVENLAVKGKLNNISFSLRKGEVLGIAGLLGSGRTELARAIFGLERIASGSIHVKKKMRKIRSPQKAIDLGIGFLTEDRKMQGLVMLLSVKENISLPSVARLSRFGVMNTAEETEAAQRFVNDLRIKTPSLEQKVMFLSGGNQQKVVLSKWLCSHAEILIFDEPTRGVDVGAKVEIYELMNELTAKGVGIIMISSELPEILGMSDRILVMAQGTIAGQFLSAEANQEKILHCALGETYAN